MSNSTVGSTAEPPHTPKQSSTASFTPPQVPSQLKFSSAGYSHEPSSSYAYWL